MMALSMLLEGGVSALPVVDAEGVLLDVYARSDITLLAKNRSYSRLQLEDMTVAQALSLAGLPHSPSQGSADPGAAPSSYSLLSFSIPRSRS
jgi:CBS-domain-containing membrane protein